MVSHIPHQNIQQRSHTLTTYSHMMSLTSSLENFICSYSNWDYRGDFSYNYNIFRNSVMKTPCELTIEHFIRRRNLYLADGVWRKSQNVFKIKNCGEKTIHRRLTNESIKRKTSLDGIPLIEILFRNGCLCSWIP